MNDRIHEMDKFLKFFARVYIQNPDLEINKDSFYSELTKYDFSKEECNNRDIMFNFNRWIKYNENKKNLDVFWSLFQKRFLQFQNTKVEHGKEYKLYLSFPKDKIFEHVNKIFDFIDKNDMPTYSKVADVVRSDAVVLRMVNKDDVAKLFNFVNNDDELVRDARKTNPFLMRNGIIGFGYDDNLSYNSALCDLFEIYFKDCRKNNTLGNVSLDNFKRYADRFYKDVFINGSKTYEFNKNIRLDRKFRSEGFKLLNYEQIYKFINCSLSNNFDSYHYFRVVENFRDKDSNVEKAVYYEQLLDSEKQLNNDSKSDSTVQNSENRKYFIRNILNNYLTLAYEKYGSAEAVYNYLAGYMAGNLNSITRDDGFRKVFSKQINSSLLLEVSNGDLKGYVYNFINNLVKYNLFCDACIATNDKYGYKQLYHAVIGATNGDFKYFTNGSNFRDNLRNNIKNSDISSLCMMYLRKNGYELSNNQDLYYVFCQLISKNNLNINDSDYSR